MRIARALLAPIASTPFLLLPATASAQSDVAIAEQLFRDGRTLFEAGKTDEACEKFAASQRMSPGLGTELNLALCREKQGRVATAWSLFTDAEASAQRAGDATRARFAHDHETALAGELKKVVIEVPSPPPGMVVKLDGTPLPAGALGTEIPLDPGDHDLVVTAPGKKTWEQSHLSLGPSATTIHVRVELEDDVLAAAAPAPAPAAASSPSAPVSPDSAVPAGAPPSGADQSPETATSTNTKRVAGFVVGGAGIVALGIAGYYGLTAISRHNDEANYPDGSPNQVTAYDEAKTAQTWGLVFAGVGVAALGVGAYLVISSYGHSDSQPAAAASWRVIPSVGGLNGAILQHAF